MGGGFLLFSFLFLLLLSEYLCFISELILGRRAQRGAVGVFENLAPKSDKWRIIGWLSTLSPFLILSYYCVVAGWGLNYVFMSLCHFL